MITTKTYKTFINETLDGQFTVTNPLDFDQTIPGGPWNTEAEAIAAFDKYVQAHQIEFV